MGTFTRPGSWILWIRVLHAAGAGAPRSKRARKAVDYEALNKQLEAEAAAKKEEQQRP